ncbi:MAG: hypothetical protein WBC09_06100, partial [Thermoanaerobaculia bacterium]
ETALEHIRGCGHGSATFPPLGLDLEATRAIDVDDLDVKLEPPVNKVLPVSRSALSSLWKAFEVGK